MLSHIEQGDVLVCLNCGKPILLTNKTFTLDCYAEYIECPCCKAKYDVQVYHARGSKLLGKEADQFIVDEANAYTKGEKMTNKYMKGHLIDYTCLKCKHYKTSAEEVPCSYCCNNYQSQYEDAPQAKEFTEEELIKVFKDRFMERRAIGILDIERVIKELFE